MSVQSRLQDLQTRVQNRLNKVTPANYLGNTVKFDERGLPDLRTLKLPSDKDNYGIWTFKNVFPPKFHYGAELCYIKLAIAYLQNPSTDILGLYNQEIIDDKSDDVEVLIKRIHRDLGDGIYEKASEYLEKKMRELGKVGLEGYSPYSYPYSPHFIKNARHEAEMRRQRLEYEAGLEAERLIAQRLREEINISRIEYEQRVKKYPIN